MSMPLRSPIWLTAVLAVALAARLAASVVVEGYWLLAGQIAAGRDYAVYEPPRRILRMPGLPVLLAGGRLAFGDQLLLTRCLLAVLGAVGCGCVYWLGRELAGHEVGLIAAAATAVSPALIAFSPLLLSESTFATAMTASLIPLAMLLKVRGEESPRLWVSASAGLLCAIATFLRPTWLPAVLLAAVLTVAWGRFRRARWF
jgi:4-amino-4-deoxy-L-arabinose transferase-like glycosyltransferase